MPVAKEKPSILQPILVVLLVVAAFLVGSLWSKVQFLEQQAQAPATLAAAGDSAGPAPALPAAREVDPVTEEDHIRGDKNARLAWIEYSDLECPFCKRIHPDLQKLIQDYDGKVKWVYRHWPILSIHTKAAKEAEATECAGELGGEEVLWAMVDKIFEVTPSNDGLNLDDLPKLAAQIGLNQQAFKSCLDSGKYEKLVQEHFTSGEKAGVTGTPGNILLDTKTGRTELIPGAVPYAQIKQAVDSFLAQQ